MRGDAEDDRSQGRLIEGGRGQGRCRGRPGRAPALALVTRHGSCIRKPAEAQEDPPVSLGELIHQHVRVAIETAVHEELPLAESHLTRCLFGQILGPIERLAGHPT